LNSVDESFLPSISNLTRLTHLDLSRPAESLPDLSPNLTTLLTSLGPSLTHLSLSAHSLLTDATLSLLLPENCPLLTHLDLSYIPDLDDELFSGMLDTWAENGCVGLESVNLTKAAGLTGMSLDALGRLAGRSLRELSINGWKDVEEEKVKQLGRTMPKLRRVDLGFCRSSRLFWFSCQVSSRFHRFHLLIKTRFCCFYRKHHRLHPQGDLGCQRTS
jgi:DNA repair protein RAD7